MTRLSHNCSLDLGLLPKELGANELFLSCGWWVGGRTGIHSAREQNPIDALVSPHTNGPMGQLYMCVYI